MCIDHKPYKGRDLCFVYWYIQDLWSGTCHIVSCQDSSGQTIPK